jgi:hypothetical protein
MAIDLDRSILLASGTLMLLLAGAILASAPGRALHRALAALVAARGATVLLPQMSADERWLVAAVNVQPYFVFAVVVLALYCIHLAGAPRPRRGTGWMALGAIVALDGLYLLDHSLLHTIAPGEAATGALAAGYMHTFTAFGPLAVVAGLVLPLLAVLGLVFALRYRRDAETPDGTMHLLLAGGLLLGSLFDGTSRLAALTALLDSGAPYPWLPWGWAVAALPVAALLPALLGVAVLAAGRNVHPRPQRLLEGRLLVLSAFAFFSGFLRLAGPSSSDPGGATLVLVLLGAWRMSMPILVAYALVAASRDGVVSQTREAIAWVTLAILVAATGAAAWSLAALAASPPFPLLAGVAAAALLSLASRGLLRGCRRFADWLVPITAQPPAPSLRPAR